MKKDIERARKSPDMADFEKRIIKRITEVDAKNYIKVRGRVSRVLVYSHVITGRFSLGEHFPKDKIGILMNIAKYTAFTWWCLAYMLRWREYHR